MMIATPELLWSYAFGYVLVSSFSLVGLDLPKMVMGNAALAKIVGVVIMVLNGLVV